MKLAAFIQNLFEEGAVTVAGSLQPFEEEDLRDSVTLLQGYYDEDALEMPGIAPAFSPDAARWAAQYLYRAVQLAVLRDLGAEVVRENLKAFASPVTPEAIYSVDLTFRYLPDLLRLTKGLAPDDVLVTCLQQTVHEWPFSSVGTGLSGDVNLGVILGHPSLKYAYVDRIIREKDLKRMDHKGITELVQQALGPYASALWPDFTHMYKQ